MGDTRAMGSGEATEDVVAVKCRLGLKAMLTAIAGLRTELKTKDCGESKG